MAINAPQFFEPLVSQEDLKAKPAWVNFFNDLYNGDAGEFWTPEFTNLTEAGGDASITGRYYQLSSYLSIFYINISPATSTSATAASTYVDNFPITFSNDGIVLMVTDGLGGGLGHIVASTNRIYVPAWSGVTTDLTLVGLGFTG